MNLENNRLRTFSNWPVSAPVDPARLARGGFFYTGEGTEVQCFSCNGKISQWNYGDQVMWRHRLMEPHCTFVAHPSLSGNVNLVNCPISPTWTEEEGQTESDSVIGSTPDYGLIEDDEIYRNDALRLLSFINWEDASISREALVNAGFYHAGGGCLRCAWCGGELAPYNNLGSLGSPLEIHRMYFPRCDHAATLMASTQSSNPSMSTSPLSETPPVRSPVSNDPEPQSSGAAHNSRILNAGGTWRALGVVSGGARHPTHASLTARLASFQLWPVDRTQTPLALAEAGFFHTGTDDQVDEVRCFYCDGGLGKWEPGDAPWSEHARWFPSCGYVLLVKGQDFVDSCEPRSAMHRLVSTESRRRNPGLPVTEEQINECLESIVGMGALSAGLDAARVKRAIARRLRNTGTPFPTPESLIDAVLDEQLNEEAWSVTTNSQRFARDILAETLQEFIPRHYRRPVIGTDVDGSSSRSQSTRSPSPVHAVDRIHPESNQNRSNTQNRSISQNGSSSQNRSPGRNRSPRQNRSTSQNNSPCRNRSLGQNRSSSQNRSQSQNRSPIQNRSPRQNRSSSQNRSPSQNESPSQIKTSAKEHSNNSQQKDSEKDDGDSEKPFVERTLTLEEENRQLKESRICKVCMDSEVSVVFLPCGHLVSCARCGAALSACPLCRAHVKALVRAYLA